MQDEGSRPKGPGGAPGQWTETPPYQQQPQPPSPYQRQPQAQPSQAYQAPRYTDELDPSLIIPRTRIWPYLLALGVVLLAGGSFVAWRYVQPVTRRVLVAVDLNGYAWQGSKAAQTINASLQVRLASVGFEVIPVDDTAAQKVLQSAASPEEAARKMKAAYVLRAKLSPQVIKHAVATGYFEGRVQGAVELVYRSEAPLRVGALSSYSGALTEAQAVELLAQSIADEIFDAALPALTVHPPLKELIESGSTDAGSLSHAIAYVELRNKALQQANAAYENLTAARRLAEHGGSDITYHGKLDSQSGLSEVGSNGILIFRSKSKPFFMPDSKEVGYMRDLDSLLWLGFDGVEHPVMSAYNIYGYPAVSGDGKRILFVEDIFGWAKTLSVAEGAGEPRRLRVDAAHRFLSPRMAPDGQYAAMLDKACDTCDPGLIVVSMRDGKTAFESPSASGGIGGYDWLARDELLMALRKPSGPDGTPSKQQIYLVSFKGGILSLKVVYEAPAGETFHWVRAARDASKVILIRNAGDGKQLARFDVESGKLETFALPEQPGFPMPSIDGSAAAFELGSDIYHFSFASQVLTRLTQNRVRDRYPTFAPDGKRIYFESIDEDPNFPRSLGVSVIASVKTP